MRSTSAVLGLNLGRANIQLCELNEIKLINLASTVVPNENLETILEWRQGECSHLENLCESTRLITLKLDRVQEQVSQVTNDNLQFDRARDALQELELNDVFESEDITRDVGLKNFYFTMAHGGLPLSMIEQFSPEMKKMIEECIASRKVEISESQYVPRGRHDDVQEKLNEVQLRAAHLEDILHIIQNDNKRLQEALAAEKELSKSCQNQNEALILARDSKDLQLSQLQTDYEAATAEAKELHNRQVERMSLLDLCCPGASSRQIHLWDTVLGEGPASTVEVTSQSGVVCNWLEPQGMEIPYRHFDGLNVHRLCCETIMCLTEQPALDMSLTMLLTKTASELYNASVLSEELCEKLAHTICAFDLDCAVPFDIALALCQILRKISERFPAIAAAQQQFRREISLRFDENESRLLRFLVDGWSGNLWDQVATCSRVTSGEKFVSVTAVSSIQAFLVLDNCQYMRWVGRKALVRLLSAQAWLKIDGSEVCFKSGKNLLDLLYSLSEPGITLFAPPDDDEVLI
ncbi:hypothetical protein CRV24_006856 [Beauveria bassiana]|nr:hypothetical protein CRV24_006856 [Beauveria bassiana]